MGLTLWSEKSFLKGRTVWFSFQKFCHCDIKESVIDLICTFIRAKSSPSCIYCMTLTGWVPRALRVRLHCSKRSESTDVTVCWWVALVTNVRAGGKFQCFLKVFTLVSSSVYYSTWRERWYVSPKRRLTANELHGIVPHKIILFVTTAVRTSCLKSKSRSTNVICFKILIFREKIFWRDICRTPSDSKQPDPLAV
jgi:hypothetical protein